MREYFATGAGITQLTTWAKSQLPGAAPSAAPKFNKPSPDRIVGFGSGG
jgi:hypothetical protein